MSKRFINGSDFTEMVFAGADNLQRHVDHVNALNVFPVPDGDTGTNMNLTMGAGVQELRGKPSDLLSKATEALSKGLLMGARGNSGVILSQLFRGFSRGVAGLEQVGTVQFAAALQQGVDTAYRAVVKPVEGTILTVAKEAAKHAVYYARRTQDMTELLEEVCSKANEALARTPDLLPVLKQVGVVDSGGQGLVYIYEGFLQRLRLLSGGAGSGPASAVWDGGAAGGTGAVRPASGKPSRGTAAGAVPGSVPAPVSFASAAAQSQLATETIEFLYDMEFFIHRTMGAALGKKFDEAAFKRALAQDGDSILVIVEEDIIKVHVHSRKPGDVLNLALPFGELTDIQILNMREQHRNLLHDGTVYDESSETASAWNGYVNQEDEELAAAMPEVLTGAAAPSTVPEEVHELAPYGIISVAMGEGIASIFLDNHVDIVLSGGQTMNPSAEDFVQAIHSLSAEHIFILPNNGNIILAAQQAAELSERSVSVLPTRSIPQGLAALLAFKDHETPQRNEAFMEDAAGSVQSGQVTHAVRDTVIDDLTIAEGDFIGIQEKAIVSASPDLQQTCRELLARMIGDSGELVTVLTGEDASQATTEELTDWLRETYPEIELEVHSGGQPLYPYLFAVE
ncbi:DAK2 domain-containing protein [Paenibacillus sp. GCM10012307]|uniref:DAK2 domain-containing protein n=1 Tax=Paenibacillus roseus TaxID=2798579 RepID=A0A934J1Z1_9BACL|nr:DAK2 domain-containing protein [Paenibacillus roseus]MBJ6363316.1 DAK2 domain-containing protein [Paenibacillus roseus]